MANASTSQQRVNYRMQQCSIGPVPLRIAYITLGEDVNQIIAFIVICMYWTPDISTGDSFPVHMGL